MVKRILGKHGYPPDLQDEAVNTVLAQAELLCADWTGAVLKCLDEHQRWTQAELFD
jgi:hypothetical protein